ncbi:MAG: GAF domain-containing protein [Leptolyngbyaceae cyanobacterium SM2_5_2]|nr:GAF domain-containing protein [Leptolyngbyaceae cyanobacterium SM2_5_2]
MQWFSNLKVGKKQLTGLLTAEILSVIGLVGVGSYLIISGGRHQLLNQATAELSVAEIEYNIKVNQMGFGFRGQSDNRAIVDVAVADAAGATVSAAELAAVREILQNEVEARQIEYATLVGKDLQIIANANADRRDQKFDPDGLVGTVLQNPRQIKTSAIVSWEELQNEAPPLPEGFSEQDALIRYTVTPVKDPNSGDVVGALVSGDIVNGKDGIPRGALAPFLNGYSGIYQRQEDGSFGLTTSLYAGDNTDLEAADFNLSLDDPTLLQQGAAIPGQAVTRRDPINGKTYTLAAKTIQDFKGEPVAVLVRGTSETPLNKAIRQSLQIQLLIALLAVAADIALAQILGRSILRPLGNLQTATQRFTQGDRSARADVFATDEVGQVAHTFNQLADSIVQSEQQLQRQTQQEKLKTSQYTLLSELNNRIRKTLNEQNILNTAVDGLRDLLGVDRALIYRFRPDYSGGEIIAESVGRGWKRIMGQTINDPLTPEALERFFSGRVTWIEDREKAELTHCHCEILERMEVHANMVAPLLAGDELIGLVCAHQCDGPRAWSPLEVDLIQQATLQIGDALGQARILKEQELTATRERELNELTSRLRESLDEARIYRAAVTETRRILEASRVVVYHFDANWKGTFVAESIAQGWTAALGTTSTTLLKENTSSSTSRGGYRPSPISGRRALLSAT